MAETKLIAFDLSILSKEVIEVLLLDSTVELSLFDEIARKNTHRPEILSFLLTHSRTPQDTRQFVASTLQLPVPSSTELQKTAGAGREKLSEEDQEDHRVKSLYLSIQRLKVGEKIQLALRGSREIRTLLLRDTNQEVVKTVLENPKITDSEIELISKQKTTADEVLRTIAKKREWLRNYSINFALATNPKTPPPIAIKCISKLRIKDLSSLEKNRNIPEAVRAAVKKMLSVKRQN